VAEIRHVTRGHALATTEADPTGRVLAAGPAVADEALFGICLPCQAAMSPEDVDRLYWRVFAMIDAALGRPSAR